MYIPGWSIFEAFQDESCLSKMELDRICESRVLDYKREVGSGKDISKDLSAFANSDGGCIFYGIDENAGAISNIVGLAGDISKIQETIEQVADSTIRPKISLCFHKIALKSGNAVLIVGVAKSKIKPHLAYSDNKRYFVRNVTTTDVADPDQIRSMIRERDSVDMQMQSELDRLIAKHKSAIKNPNTEIVEKTLTEVIYAMPLIEHSISIPLLEKYPRIDDLFLEWRAYGQKRYVQRAYYSSGRNGYLKLHDSGSVESCCFLQTNQERRFGEEQRATSVYLVKDWISKVKELQRYLKHMQIAGPVAILGALVNSKNVSLRASNPMFETSIIMEDDVIFKPFLLENREQDITLLFKDWVNTLYNACGRPECTEYDNLVK